MKKLLTILLILFVGFAAFAQESVVVVLANDTVPAQDDSMFYVGVEGGASSINNLAIDKGIGNQLSISPLVGFELSPVFGFRPFADTNLSFEINVLMDFLEYTSYGTGLENSNLKYMTSSITPQILAVYTFGTGIVRPFAGLGMGANFNALAIEGKALASDGTLETATDNYSLNTSFSMAVKGGVKVSIPNSSFDVYALCRYNVNIPTELKFKDQSTKATMNASTLSAALGVVYNF